MMTPRKKQNKGKWQKEKSHDTHFEFGSRKNGGLSSPKRIRKRETSELSRMTEPRLKKNGLLWMPHRKAGKKMEIMNTSYATACEKRKLTDSPL